MMPQPPPLTAASLCIPIRERHWNRSEPYSARIVRLILPVQIYGFN
jgi:hypothetical protein